MALPPVVERDEHRCQLNACRSKYVSITGTLPRDLVHLREQNALIAKLPEAVGEQVFRAPQHCLEVGETATSSDAFANDQEAPFLPDHIQRQANWTGEIFRITALHTGIL